jgi:predicted nucleic acid-binding protein
MKNKKKNVDSIIRHIDETGGIFEFKESEDVLEQIRNLREKQYEKELNLAKHNSKQKN